MSKSLRFTPGSFLEVDDLGGGRKVVLVAKDGATFWDAMEVERVTPIVIHAELHPAELGTLHDLVAKRGLTHALGAVIAYARAQLDPRIDTDPLLVGRVLWFLSQKSEQRDPYVPDDATVRWAFTQAEAQAHAALAVHEQVEKYLTQHPNHA